MHVRLLTFASASDAVGANELDLELKAGSTVADLKQLLDSRYPSLAGLWSRLAVAVDGEIATDDQEIPENSEVALLPPVSGGAPTASALEARVELVQDPLDVQAIAAQVSRPEAGAVVLFVGNVRNHNDGQKVERITYFSYRRMARLRLERIVRELESAQEDLRVAVSHRLGPIEVGEASIAIATSSPHREAAYEANRQALERIKAEVPIWKREHYRSGAHAWREVEPLIAGE